MSSSLKLDLLPPEVSAIYMRLLTNDDLLHCRLVSKRLKQCAEYALKERKEAFEVINGEYENADHLGYLCRFYSKVKSVLIKTNSKTRFEKITLSTIFELCGRYFTNVLSLAIKNVDLNRIDKSYFCDAHNSHLIADNFSNIASLSLSRVKLNDENMSLLFKRLKNLHKLELDETYISGSCFADCSDSITSIDWKLSYGGLLSDIVTFNGKGINMSYFSFHTNAGIDVNIIIDFVNEMENLKILKIHAFCGKIQNRRFKQENVEEFWLCLLDIDDSCFVKPWFKTKKLLLKSRDTREENLVANLSKFPNIDKLCIICYSMDHFALSLIHCLSSFRFLKSFCFRDYSYNKDVYMTLGDSESYALVEAVRMMSNVTNFNISLFTNVVEVNGVINKIVPIAIERPNCKFHFTDSHLSRDGLPPNVFIHKFIRRN